MAIVARLAVVACKKSKHQKCHESIKFIGNNDKRSFIKRPGHFAKLKKSSRTEFLTRKKRTCSGRTGRMAALVQIESHCCALVRSVLDYG